MILKNAKIVTLKKVIDNGYIEIEDKKIKSVHEGEYLGKDETIDLQGNIVMPGFIDLHIHGSAGYDFMDASVDEMKIIADSLYKEGTTTFLATTLTADQKHLRKVAKTVYLAKKEIPSLLGIHLEGPYIALKYKGAQNEKFVQDFNIEDLEKLIKISHKNIRYITLAPEKPNSAEFIEFATKNNICVSVGHSEASFKDVEEAIKHGLRCTTHTHNAMSPHHHRNPGVVTAAFYFDQLFTEMILDGIHVNRDVVKTTYKIVGPNRFMIVTDSLSGKHTTEDRFMLGGLDVIKKDGAAYLTTGPLAGSLLTMDKAVQNLNDFADIDLIGLAKASSTNQARALKLKDRGLIARGKKADLVILNKDNLDLLAVYKEGKKVA